MSMESTRYIAEQEGGNVGGFLNARLYGQEKNLGTWAISKINMTLHKFMNAEIKKVCTLATPRHKTSGVHKIKMPTFAYSTPDSRYRVFSSWVYYFPEKPLNL